MGSPAIFSLTKKHFSSQCKLPFICRVEIKGKDVRIIGLSIFKTGIEPAWEDPVNKLGGHYDYILGSLNKHQVDSLWKIFTMNLITCHFPDGDLLTGVRVVDKSNDKKQ